MSMPSSRVLVDTSPLISPPLKPASTRSRSSRGREPWWTATSWRTRARREPRSSASGRAFTKMRVDRLSSSESLEVSVRDATETLEADRELDPPAVRRELMDLVDDDVAHAPEVALHQLSREDRLQSLGGGDQDIRRVCGLFPALRRWSVPMPYGRHELGRRDEAENSVDEISVECAKRRDVEGANPLSIARPERLKDRKQSGFRLPRPGRCDDEQLRTRPDLANRLGLHLVHFRDPSAIEQLT